MKELTNPGALVRAGTGASQRLIAESATFRITEHAIQLPPANNGVNGGVRIEAELERAFYKLKRLSRFARVRGFAGSGQWGGSEDSISILSCFAGPHPRETLWGPTPTAASASLRSAPLVSSAWPLG
jgi:hypothetical protein